MKRLIAMAAFTVASLGLMEGTALAWHVTGTVYCDANLNGVIDAGDLPVSGLTVTVTGVGNSFSGSDTTGNYGAGSWAVFLPDTPGNYKITLTGNTSPIISPASLNFSTTADNNVLDIDILLDGQGCTELKCWLTGGGVKFNPLTNTRQAEKGPFHTFGGNVNPSCSPEPGDGGQWTHTAHKADLHFQGQSIQVVRCGNVADIPPGSTSPVTPYNFIEFQGTGILKGVGGNKVDYGTVTFFARAEDRNEPGGEAGGNNSGATIDRYFLRVVDGGGTTRLLVDVDGNAATVDPISITGGNLQLHISSCSK
jgi:hypothetical protein